MIYQREFVNPVTGFINIVELKKNITFKTSPIPGNFNELKLFLFKIVSQSDIVDFDIEILAGRDFVEVNDDNSYELIVKYLHEAAGKKTSLTGIKIRVLSSDHDDKVSIFLAIGNVLGFCDICIVKQEKAKEDGA